MKTKEVLLEELKECVIEMEDEEIVDVAKEYIQNGYDAFDGVQDGLCKGMERAGELFEEEEYYIPELLICSDAMYEGIGVLKEHIIEDPSAEKLKAVVGVVEGDTHDIGKNIYKIMLESNGFEVIDLGRDVTCESFIETARKEKAHLIGMSTLMTTTMGHMKEVIEALEKEGIRDEVVVMVGGGPISRSFAETIGADGYERDAALAAKLAKNLVKTKLLDKIALGA
ncbi:MAG: corrinoid protein [Tissierellales bacterium]|jgi:corrinoid protein of di/trimethylamine methyltransferase|nr:corrinoid protein [Tissierellales bacterium]